MPVLLMRASLLTMAGAPDLKNKHGETPENTAKSERKSTVLLWSSIETLYVSGEFLSGIEFGSNRKCLEHD
ncbi:hypothetical protein H3S90_06685 [Bartonella sp. W8097]|uniref:hypothetical protein n=1 Tax=Bartonella apihabitans TaxID=2750929 RepID=UPI0018DDE53F|nr:hypothetical protein [Bartonella apihabitans]MBI0020770.1 hypothetical protein [Bartonella apihabitans]